MSCQNQPDEFSIPENADPKLEILSQMGFDTDNVIELENMYIVEGDIMISRDHIEEFLEFECTPKTRQRYYGDVFKIREPGKTVYIENNNSTFHRIYGDAMLEACEAWNEVPESKIKFAYAYGTSIPDRTNVATVQEFDYYFYENGSPHKPLLGKMITEVSPPSSGKPSKIQFNPDSKVYSKLNHKQKVWAMVHSLGHLVALGHTDEIRREGFGFASEFGESILVPGTPSSDAGSVMNNSNFIVKEWDRLSDWDKFAIRTLYPADPPTPPDPDYIITGPSQVWTDRVYLYTFSHQGSLLLNGRQVPSIPGTYHVTFVDCGKNLIQGKLHNGQIKGEKIVYAYPTIPSISTNDNLIMDSGIQFINNFENTTDITAYYWDWTIERTDGEGRYTILDENLSNIVVNFNESGMYRIGFRFKALNEWSEWGYETFKIVPDMLIRFAKSESYIGSYPLFENSPHIEGVEIIDAWFTTQAPVESDLTITIKMDGVIETIATDLDIIYDDIVLTFPKGSTRTDNFQAPIAYPSISIGYQHFIYTDVKPRNDTEYKYIMEEPYIVF